VAVQLHLYLTLQPNRYQWFVSSICRFNPRKRPPTPEPQPLGGWVGPTVGLDALERRKHLVLMLTIEPRFIHHGARSQITALAELPDFYTSLRVGYSNAMTVYSDRTVQQCCLAFGRYRVRATLTNKHIAAAFISVLPKSLSCGIGQHR
jgi:hypothetical protein